MSGKYMIWFIFVCWFIMISDWLVRGLTGYDEE